MITTTATGLTRADLIALGVNDPLLTQICTYTDHGASGAPVCGKTPDFIITVGCEHEHMVSEGQCAEHHAVWGFEVGKLPDAYACTLCMEVDGPSHHCAVGFIAERAA